MVEMRTTTADEMEPAPAMASAERPSDSPEYEVPAERRALVKQWEQRVTAAKRHFAKDFKRMKENMQFATHGADKEWIDSGQYVVPIVNRHINQAVAQLYAKDPRAEAKRRKRLMYTVWDGTPESLNAAVMAAQAPPTMDPMTGMVAEPDPMAMQLLQEIEAVKQENAMIDKMGETMTILWRYFTGEQANGFKEQMKALVRRTKVCGVGYVKLAFQRELRPNPEKVAAFDEASSQVAAMEKSLAKLAAGEIEEHSAQMEELKLLAKQLEQEMYVIAREGPLFDFPRSTEIIVDPKCRHLKTFAGARWIAHQFDMTPDEVLEVYKVDIKGKFKGMTVEGEKSFQEKTLSEAGDNKAEECARIYEIQDRKLGQTLTICEGYCDFLKEPGVPDVRIERFFTVFPLVFNEIENDEQLYPPSDVHLLRDTQGEYNRARQGLREHRVSNRPGWASSKGSLSKEDKAKLTSRPAHALLELQALKPGQRVDELIQRLPASTIDPAQYDVEAHFQDILRTVGSQEANLGGTANSTATESSIAENSRASSRDDNVDDLDNMLTELAKATGQLMLFELAKETVLEIVGPGAVWPEVQGNREQIAKDLFLEIKAGSSGRPNAAADLAKLERAMPYLLQIPGVNPRPVVSKYADLLDQDMDEFFVDGLPSMVAMNQQSQPGNGDPETDPNQQGGEGGANDPAAQQGNEGPQPAYPAA